MKYADAKKKLPRFAHGLTKDINRDWTDMLKVSALRQKVRSEVAQYLAGANPLEEKQAQKLIEWLAEVA